MSLLVPDTGLLFWMIVSFGIVFLILVKYGFPVITQAVEKRNQYIESSLEAACQAQEQLAAINTQAESILQEARSKRNTILNEAQDIRNKIMSEARETAETQARFRIDRANAEIEESRNKAIISIKDEITGISVKMAEKVLSEKLEDEEKQRRLINRLLDEELVSNV